MYFLEEKPLQIKNKEKPKNLITIKIWIYFTKLYLIKNLFINFLEALILLLILETDIWVTHYLLTVLLGVMGKIARNKISVNDINSEDFTLEPYLY